MPLNSQIRLAFLTLFTYLCLFGCSHRLRLNPADNKVMKNNDLALSVEWIKDKGKKYDLRLWVTNDSDTPLQIMVKDIECFKGKTQGTVRGLRTPRREKFLRLPPSNVKKFTFNCYLYNPTGGTFKVKIKNVYRQESSTTKKRGKLFARNLQWSYVPKQANEQELADTPITTKSDRSALKLKLGKMFFSGNRRAYVKYNKQLLDKDYVEPANVLWVRWSKLFKNNVNPGIPITGLNLGLINYRASESANIGDSRVSVSTSGVVFDFSLKIGINPFLKSLLIFTELGSGLQIVEIVKVESKFGSDSYYDDGRLLPFFMTAGIEWNVWQGLLLDVAYTREHIFKDNFFMAGVGYAY